MDAVEPTVLTVRSKSNSKLHFVGVQFRRLDPNVLGYAVHTFRMDGDLNRGYAANNGGTGSNLAGRRRLHATQSGWAPRRVCWNSGRIRNRIRRRHRLVARAQRRDIGHVSSCRCSRRHAASRRRRGPVRHGMRRFVVRRWLSTWIPFDW